MSRVKILSSFDYRFSETNTKLYFYSALQVLTKIVSSGLKRLYLWSSLTVSLCEMFKRTKQYYVNLFFKPTYSFRSHLWTGVLKLGMFG